MFDRFLDLLFPRHSLLGREGEWVTEEERQQLRMFPIVQEKPVLRRRGLHHIDRLIAAGSFREYPLLRTAIHAWKYRGITALTSELGRPLVEASSFVLTRDQPALCPIPLHWIRKFSRGFNQAELLAEVLSRERGLPVRHLLRRRWPWSRQVGKGRSGRFTAMKSAFAFYPLAHCPLTDITFVLLIDDVSTSGATLDACARVLKENGFRRVEGLVLGLG